MKGNISLKDFITEIRTELEQAQVPEKDAFFALQEVQLEVSFALDASAKGSGKFIVVEVAGETKATQTHKVTLKLVPATQRAPATDWTDIIESIGSKKPSKHAPGTIPFYTVAEEKIVTGPFFKEIEGSLEVPKIKIRKPGE